MGSPRDAFELSFSLGILEGKLSVSWKETLQGRMISYNGKGRPCFFETNAIKNDAPRLLVG
jgi:hypothetical protein